MKRRRIINLLICFALGMGVGNSLTLFALTPNIFYATVAIITIIAMVLNLLFPYGENEEQNKNEEQNE